MLIHSSDPRPSHPFARPIVVGEVTFNDRTATTLLQSFVDDQVRLSLDGRNESDRIRYEVAFFDEDSLSEVNGVVQ